MKKLFPILCILLMSSCTWMQDNTDDCPYGFWLKLHYAYNILDVEAAPKYVTDAYVYVYDADGKYIERIHVTKEDLSANDYRVRIENLPEGDYQFVVWSGMANSQYAVSGDTRTIEDFRISLVGAGGNYSGELPDLYYGYQQAVHFDDNYAVHDVQLVKNTNQLAALVVTISDEVVMNPDDYTMNIVSDNGTMDAYNRLVPTTGTTYEPYLKEAATIDDAEYGKLNGIKFSISTLRLINSNNNRLILQNEKTKKTIFNISFAEYIGMVGALYTNLGKEITVQEYLDRQDHYTFVFYLSEDLERLIQMQVNSWRLRVNNHLKL